MAVQAFCSGPLPGTQLRTVQKSCRQRRSRSSTTVAGVSKKVNTYDDKWSKVSTALPVLPEEFFTRPV